MIRWSIPVILSALAASHAHGAVAARLLDVGADVDIRDERGRTPLYVAAEQGHEGVVEILLARKAAVNLATVKGATPLYIATYQERAGTIAMLLKAGADP